MKKYSSKFVCIVAIGFLVVGQTVQQIDPEFTSAPKAEIKDPQDGYIIKFITHGFDITKINLFGNLSLENLKGIIFKPTGGHGTVCSTDKNYCYHCQNTFIDITPVESNRTKTTVYKLEKALHPLLNANVSDQSAGNYSYQLYESSYYGRVSAESIYNQSYWKVNLRELGSAFLDDHVEQQFKDDAMNLTGKNITDYFKFIEQYGTHYFTEVIFGGMFRVESKANDRFVNDVSENDYKMYLEKNLERAIDVNNSGNYSVIPFDFYYHNHYENFTYGGDGAQIFTQNDFANWQKTIEANIVPIGWEKDTIYNLIQISGNAWNFNATEIVQNLKLATETIEAKYKIKSYLEGLKVIQDNLYGRSMAGHFNPFTLQTYFEDKLKEDSPVLDQTFWDNCWCTDHCAETILNRREWFPKPLPIQTTTSPPSTFPSTTSTVTTPITTTISPATTPSTIATTPTIPTTASSSTTPKTETTSKP